MPRLADVRCERIRFQPGDRVLVKANCRMELEQKAKLRKAIERWAGCAVEVLIYCPLDFTLEIEHQPLRI